MYRVGVCSHMEEVRVPAGRHREHDAVALLDTGSDDYGATRNSLPDDVTGKAVHVCENWLLRPYRGALIFLGWLSNSKCGSPSQVILVSLYLCVIIGTFVMQCLVCFQHDQLFLTKEECVTDLLIDENLICCKKHIITAFVFHDVLILTTYLFGVYHFSTTETDHLSKLAGEVFVKTAHATGGRFPKRLIATIGAYFVAGIAWIVLSAVVKFLYLEAFRYLDDNVHVVWNNFSVPQDVKEGFIVTSIVGFIIIDIVYTASIINYAIQSELNVHLLKAISRLAETKQYTSIDEGIKDIRNAEGNLRVLNGKAATAASLVVFQLSISAVIAWQQLNELNQFVDSKDLGNSTDLSRDFSQVKNEYLSLAVGFLNVVLWTSVVVFAFVQASRVTGAGRRLKTIGVYLRSRPLQYANDPQSDLDSIVAYTHAVSLRAKLFGVPVYPWMINTAFTVLPFIFIVVIKCGLYSPLPFF